MSTFIVSLFLPYTVSFKDAPPPSRFPSPPPLSKRSASAVDLTGELSMLKPISPTYGEKATAEMMEELGLDDRNPHKLAHQAGDPRSFVRSDAHAPEWGNAYLLNQPRSRVKHFPSKSFNNDYTVLEDESRYQAAKKGVPSLYKTSSGLSASERTYENTVWSIEAGIQGNGGLANAIRGSTEQNGTHHYWVGTLGFPTDALGEDIKRQIHETLENEYDALPVYVSDIDLDGAYVRYCKTILWPIFNYQIPDNPKSKAFEDHSWRFYKAVNQAHADMVIASYKQGDVIWVHDYHLLLVPGMLRQKLPNAQIGFFLHTAFPSSEIFRCLPTRREMLEGVLGANLVAFQTKEYLQHFLKTCGGILTVEATDTGIQFGDRFINIASEPMGIDPNALEHERRKAEVKKWIGVIRDKYQGKHLIVARDKLDNTSGVRQKFLSYELFLDKYPEWQSNVATSSTENSELLATVVECTNRIDTKYSSLAHQPVMLLMQDMSYAQYLALLSSADVLMLTPLRDGIGLTAQDFVFCQDGAISDRKHGPVILSEFAGAVEIFDKGELRVNPMNYHECANAIKTALEMSDEEKAARYEKLRKGVMYHTGAHWGRQLINALSKSYAEQTQRTASSIPRLSITTLCDKYKASKKRLFILDFEGTLAPATSKSRLQASNIRTVTDTLKDLMADRRNIVYVMSARKPESMQQFFHMLPKMGLIAENGCFIRQYDSEDNKWTEYMEPERVAGWKKDVEKLLAYHQNTIDDSWIEERHFSMLLHCDNVDDPDRVKKQLGDCINYINDSYVSQGVHAVPISSTNSVLVESEERCKGHAGEDILRGLLEDVDTDCQRPDFLFVAGDDREDESIFRWANEVGEAGKVEKVFTVGMGKRNTEAKTTLTQGPTGLLFALQKLARFSKADSWAGK